MVKKPTKPESARLICCLDEKQEYVTIKHIKKHLEKMGLTVQSCTQRFAKFDGETTGTKLPFIDANVYPVEGYIKKFNWPKTLAESGMLHFEKSPDANAPHNDSVPHRRGCEFQKRNLLP